MKTGKTSKESRKLLGKESEVSQVEILRAAGEPYLVEELRVTSRLGDGGSEVKS